MYHAGIGLRNHIPAIRRKVRNVHFAEHADQHVWLVKSAYRLSDYQRFRVSITKATTPCEGFLALSFDCFLIVVAVFFIALIKRCVSQKVRLG